MPIQAPVRQKKVQYVYHCRVQLTDKAQQDLTMFDAECQQKIASIICGVHTCMHTYIL
jgi:hypothetical protein